MSAEGNEPSEDHLGTKSGYVTLLGRPNAGKSTLLNRFIGERLSIVTPKPQTTWQRVTGIVTSDRSQTIFLDTPGLLEPRDLLQEAMRVAAEEALAEADVILLVLDGSNPPGAGGLKRIEKTLAPRPEVPIIVAVNKADLASEEAIHSLSVWARDLSAGEAFPTSALKGDGVETLRERLEEVLPPGPFLYPPDEIARDPVRFFVAEMIRETVFQEFRQELPYSTFCQIEEFRENQDPVYIQAQIFVERKSQKRILVGKGGSSIRSLGARSRRKIEDFLGRRVYLDLWIKVLPDWRRKRAHLKRLGFAVPAEGQGRDRA
jgi:GTP-binding protein Era